MERVRQRVLFGQNEPVWDDDDSGLYAEVVFSRPMRTTYTYFAPPRLAGKILAGKRIEAPFGRGNQRTTGFCVGVTDVKPATTKLKPILAVTDEYPLLSNSMLALTRWMADYYCCSWGQVIDAIVPKAVKQKSGTRWTTLLSPLPESERRPSAGTLTPKQTRAFESLCQLGRPASVKEIGNSARCGPDVVKALITKGWVRTSRQRMQHHVPTHIEIDRTISPMLSEPQRAAVEQITKTVADGRCETFLLHGVTGSGKTEVYLHSIAEAVRRKREAIVLVPEISLTPQTIERFRQRFDHVAVLHSHLSDVDRNWHWQRIAAGEVQVVIGARSAMFAPCKNLGLIVIDEEHETTFKQETTPRYQTRDAAQRRAELETVPLVLGSATPSLESWHAASEGRYTLLSLPERVAHLQLPSVGIVDLRGQFHFRRAPRSLSLALETAMSETLRDGGQVILLLNRRGFSTAVVCPKCGHVEMCRHCDIALTYHRDIDRALCHSCDADFDVPSLCPQCQEPTIKFSGVGTERLEDEVRARFPDFTCARMDSDSMRSAAHYEKVLGDFRRGIVKILLGTQMIAKGLDFPNVHLVGVISADTARHLPDFRASERTFQLISQVAGRTGRGSVAGRVLVQTFNPEDTAIEAAARHDYQGFAVQELRQRREFGYPPFQSLTRVIVRSKDLARARDAAESIAERIRNSTVRTPSIRVLGPAPAPVPRLRDYFRFHLQIHMPLDVNRQRLFDEVLGDFECTGDVEYVVDVDPVSML